MNHHVRPTRVVTLDGVFQRDPETGLYEPWEPDEETRLPIWLGIGVPVAATWVALTWLVWALL